jgi:multiple sugar transport system substrate-binding protein
VGTYRRPSWGLSRRAFLQGVAASAVAPPLLTACGGDEETPTATTAAPEEVGAPTTTVFEQPASRLSGNLSILLWSHFVPSHDQWFDPFAQAWGEMAGVNVTIDHINNAEIPGRVTAEITAGQGHDLIQYIAPLSQFEPSVLDLSDVVSEAEGRYGQMLDLCRRSSYNPNTKRFFAYAPGWVPDPGDYRRSLWEQADMANGPSTWQELLDGGKRIKERLGVQMGIGMSQEIDSNMAARALIWSFGGAIQDENENVVINSPQVIEAVDFMSRLYKETMTPEVFAWNAASNNQGLAAGQLSYILNSISAYRTAQEQNPVVADDVFFVPALSGPAGAFAAQHVLYNWIVPKHAANPDAAKEFLLHYTANFDHACYNSKLYDFPAFLDRVPRLNDWLADDPFGSRPADKLTFLKIEDAVKWSTNIGHPGPSNTAVGEVFGTFIIPNMMARAARGDVSARQAVEEAEGQIKPIYAKWRAQGLVGGSR